MSNIRFSLLKVGFFKKKKKYVRKVGFFKKTKKTMFEQETTCVPPAFGMGTQLIKFHDRYNPADLTSLQQNTP